MHSNVLQWKYEHKGLGSTQFLFTYLFICLFNHLWAWKFLCIVSHCTCPPHGHEFQLLYSKRTGRNLWRHIGTKSEYEGTKQWTKETETEINTDCDKTPIILFVHIVILHIAALGSYMFDKLDKSNNYPCNSLGLNPLQRQQEWFMQ